MPRRLNGTGFGLQVDTVEEYVVVCALLHVPVALKRTGISRFVAPGKLNITWSQPRVGERGAARGCCIQKILEYLVACSFASEKLNMTISGVTRLVVITTCRRARCCTWL